MGQKVNPIGMRLQVNRTWDSRWFAESKDYGNLLLEDLRMREFVHEECTFVWTPHLEVWAATCVPSAVPNSFMFFPPTAPPTAAPITTNAITSATIKNVRTFIPKIIRGGRLSLVKACLPL